MDNAPKNRVLAATVSAVIVVVFIALVLTLRAVELRGIARDKAAKEAEKTARQQEVAKDIAKANELWDSGKTLEAVIKYKELVKERNTLEENAHSFWSIVARLSVRLTTGTRLRQEA